jgi:hypothetical protein
MYSRTLTTNSQIPCNMLQCTPRRADATRFPLRDTFSNVGQRDALAAGDPRRFRAVQTPGSIGNPGLSPPRCWFNGLFLSVTFRTDVPDGPGRRSAALEKHVAPGGGAQTATVRWSVPWGPYVVGTAFPGNTFWAQGPPVRGWRWGLSRRRRPLLRVDSRGEPAKGRDPAASRCGLPRSDPQGTPPAGAEVWTNARGTNGVPATVDPRLQACGGITYRYANASPWLPFINLTHPMGPPLRHPHAVLKRYLTADRRVILINEPALGHTGGSRPSPHSVNGQSRSIIHAR